MVCSWKLSSHMLWYILNVPSVETFLFRVQYCIKRGEESAPWHWGDQEEQGWSGLEAKHLSLFIKLLKGLLDSVEVAESPRDVNTKELHKTQPGLSSRKISHFQHCHIHLPHFIVTGDWGGRWRVSSPVSPSEIFAVKSRGWACWAASPGQHHLDHQWLQLWSGSFQEGAERCSRNWLSEEASADV